MAVTNYIWHGDAVIAETDETGAVKASYTREPDEFGSLISETRNGQTHYHHYDASGSTTELTDSTGEVTDTFRYSAFGDEIEHTGSTETPYTWSGKSGYQKDGSKQFYVRRRHYSAETSRWMSTDPRLFADGPNPYLSFLNDPVNNQDPSGEITSTAKSMTNHGCDAYRQFYMEWDMKLDKPAPCDGYLVQQISITQRYSVCPPIPSLASAPCCTIPRTPSLDLGFYEAFPVKKGASRTHLPGKTDKWTWGHPKIVIFLDLCGRTHVEAQLKFFCKKTTGDLEKLWTGTAMKNINTPNVPSWFFNKPIESESFRSLEKEFNCCDCCGNKKYVEMTVTSPAGGKVDVPCYKLSGGCP